MALKPCRECKKKVSTEATVCPSCGVPNPTDRVSDLKKTTPKHIPTSNKTFSGSVKSFWNGEWSLIQTFWGYGVIGNSIVSIPIAVVPTDYEFTNGLGIFFIIYLVFYLAFFTWVFVGIWNSATNYSKHKKIWGGVAKIVVFSTVVYMVVGTIFDNF